VLKQHDPFGSGSLLRSPRPPSNHGIPELPETASGSFMLHGEVSAEADILSFQPFQPFSLPCFSEVP
jgi:hypothetical protein